MGLCISVAFLKVFYGPFTARYNLGKCIGGGAFGDVFICTKRGTDEKYAVKMMKVASNEERSLALREDGMCQTLEHENIVSLQEAGIFEREWFYMVFELIRGDTLFKAIGERLCYTERDASNLMHQLSSAIAFCHSNNIIHRDLKSENILLRTQDNRLKLIDFGIAVRASGDNPQLYGGYGTPGYIAPEILQLEPYGKPVDIWACGALFYNLLSGIHPFHSSSEMILHQLTVAGRWRYPLHQFEGVTRESIDLINAMSHADQNSRPTAADMVVRFRQLRGRNNDDIDQNRISTILRLQRWRGGIPEPTY